MTTPISMSTTILIIDDDPTIRLVLKRTLERQGHAIEIAADGRQGMELAEQKQPALIICDWMMPKMDGLEVCRRIRAMENLSTTFFILLTSRTEVEDRVKGLDAGADEFLSKPIDPNELRARVRAGLRLHQLSRDLQLQTQALEAELAEASRYVRSLLPSPSTFDQARIRTDWRFIPSQELGGDCFNYHWLDPEHLALYLLDVSGHGVGAALLSVSVINLLRSQSLPGGDLRQPRAVLQALNEAFQMPEQNEMYFTIWYGVYRPQDRRLHYASAGHPPAVLVDPSQEVTLLKTANLPIGMMTDVRFCDDVCRLPERCDLFLFSDGVYEVSNAANRLWGLESLVEALRCCDAEPASKLDRIQSLAQAHNAKPRFMDDFSLLQVSFG